MSCHRAPIEDFHPNDESRAPVRDARVYVRPGSAFDLGKIAIAGYGSHTAGKNVSVQVRRA
jgi:hypothetical protein